MSEQQNLISRKDTWSSAVRSMPLEQRVENAATLLLSFKNHRHQDMIYGPYLNATSSGVSRCHIIFAYKDGKEQPKYFDFRDHGAAEEFEKKLKGKLDEFKISYGKRDINGNLVIENDHNGEKDIEHKVRKTCRELQKFKKNKQHDKIRGGYVCKPDDMHRCKLILTYKNGSKELLLPGFSTKERAEKFRTAIHAKIEKMKLERVITKVFKDEDDTDIKKDHMKYKLKNSGLQEFKEDKNHDKIYGPYVRKHLEGAECVIMLTHKDGTKQRKGFTFDTKEETQRFKQMLTWKMKELKIIYGTKKQGHRFEKSMQHKVNISGLQEFKDNENHNKISGCHIRRHNDIRRKDHKGWACVYEFIYKDGNERKKSFFFDIKDEAQQLKLLLNQKMDELKIPHGTRREDYLSKKAGTKITLTEIEQMLQKPKLPVKALGVVELRKQVKKDIESFFKTNKGVKGYNLDGSVKILKTVSGRPCIRINFSNAEISEDIGTYLLDRKLTPRVAIDCIKFPINKHGVDISSLEKTVRGKY